MKHCSVFDLDNTLLTVNSSYRFGSYLYQHRQLTFLKMVRLVSYFWLHKLGFLSISEMQHKIFQSFFLGQPFSAIEGLAQAFVGHAFDHIQYLPAVQRLRQAKQQGHYTVILSSSPSFLVRRFAERFGVDAWEATHFGLDASQRFSEIGQLMLSDDKANYVKGLAERYQITRNNITAYSDSHHDLTFLQAAGNAVGVNPDRKLRTFCLQNGWAML